MSEQINALAATAREAGDGTSEQFIQWFIREQTEEVATTSTLLRKSPSARAPIKLISRTSSRVSTRTQLGKIPRLHTPPGHGDVRSRTVRFRGCLRMTRIVVRDGNRFIAELAGAALGSSALR